MICWHFQRIWEFINFVTLLIREVNSGFFYKSASEREKLVQAERAFTNQKVQKIIDFKNSVCTKENKKSFVVINQKVGITTKFV